MTLKTILGAAVVSLIAGPAFAACEAPAAKDDLTTEQINTLYDCLKSELREGYASEGGQYTKDYQGWKAAGTGPAAPGTHGDRFLMTFVNETAFEEYVKYSDERGAMPVGSILAKESFNVNKKQAVKKGPLFFMEKVAAGGDAEEWGNWVYTAFAPNGKPMKITQKFCHACHGAFDTQDSMGYPDEDVRLTSN